MELAEGRSGRARRANAGSRLHELLERGLDSDEERLLRDADADDTDSSFSCSTSASAYDTVDSDFSDEEVAGTLEGEAVETEADVRRDVREERRREQARRLQRMQRRVHTTTAATTTSRTRQGRQQQQQQARHDRDGNNSNEDDSSDKDGGGGGHDDKDDAVASLRAVVRQRPPSTIPLEVRMREALQRAQHVREQEAEAAAAAATTDAAASAAVLSHTPHTARHAHARAGGSRRVVRATQLSPHKSSATAATSSLSSSSLRSMQQPVLLCDSRTLLYATTAPQRVYGCSSARLRAAVGVYAVTAFARELPPVFRTA